MIAFRITAEEAKPPRTSIVVNTADGRRLKPECPICGAVSWAMPELSPDDEAENIQPVAMAQRGDKLLALPLDIFSRVYL